jgi:cytoskeletal protein CcmA (bactofilin family)
MLNKYKDRIKNSDSDHVSSHKGPSSRGNSAVIGEDVKIKGDIISQEDIIIAGEVNGIVQAKSHHVHVADTGVLNADIIGNVVSVEGLVKGNIVGLENVIITPTGNVLGNIECPRLSLEDGAKFKGSIEMNPADPTASLTKMKAHRVDPASGKPDIKAS